MLPLWNTLKASHVWLNKLVYCLLMPGVKRTILQGQPLLALTYFSIKLLKLPATLVLVSLIVRSELARSVVVHRSFKISIFALGPHRKCWPLTRRTLTVRACALTCTTLPATVTLPTRTFFARPELACNPISP